MPRLPGCDLEVLKPVHREIEMTVRLIDLNTTGYQLRERNDELLPYENLFKEYACKFIALYQELGDQLNKRPIALFISTILIRL